MTFQPTEPTEAHPTRDEYVLERALNDGGWVVESIIPAATAKEAEARSAVILQWLREAELRVVRRTVASTVVSVRPGTKEQP